MATVTALFDRYEDADRAVDMLLSRDFVKDDIGILASDHIVRERRKARNGGRRAGAPSARRMRPDREPSRKS